MTASARRPEPVLTRRPIRVEGVFQYASRYQHPPRLRARRFVGIGGSCAPAATAARSKERALGRGCQTASGFRPEVDRGTSRRQPTSWLVAWPGRTLAARLRLPNGQFVDYALRRHRPHRHGPGGVRRPAGGADRPSPTGPWTTAPTGCRTFNRKHYRDMLFTPGGGSYGTQLDARQLPGDVARADTRSRDRSRSGSTSRVPNPTSEPTGPRRRIRQSERAGLPRRSRPRLKATKGDDEGIDWSRKKVDTQDRYDCDGDGNFDEADGYVDHFQLVHAGEGEEAGGGAQGEDAIWSHRWYAGQGGHRDQRAQGLQAGWLPRARHEAVGR